MADLKFSKVDGSLPSSLSPNTVYLVKTGSTVAIYVTDEAGTQALPAGGGGGGDEPLDPFLFLGADGVD